MSDDKTGSAVDRRTVLEAVGLSALGFGGVGLTTARRGRGGPPENAGEKGGGPPENRGPPSRDAQEERTITWADGGERGRENAALDCFQGQEGRWHWVLTPEGPEEFVNVGELVVGFEDGTEVRTSGEQRGRGAYQFYVSKAGGGTVETAEITVTGGGRNAALTISDSECMGEVYWQVDFGRELSPPEPPEYTAQQFIMAAIGTSAGVSFNPSCVFAKDDIELVEREFEFDDESNPSNVEVTFTVDVAPAEERDLHLSVFTRPPEDLTDDFDQETVETAAKSGGCPIDADDVDADEQEKFGVVNGTFSSGEHTLEVDLPTP